MVAHQEAFRRLYYHLYSNSSVSRAERLIEDLALLLLTKLAVEVNGARGDFSRFLAGAGTADELLLGHLRDAVPDLVDESTQFALDDATVRSALQILDSVSMSAAPAHALGDAFQALIGPRLRGERGQFFTPRSLVRAMVGVVAPGPSDVVLDPACGTGGFLLEAGAAGSRVIGVDKDAGLARLAAAVLRIACPGRAEVFARNSLDPGSRVEGVDVVLTNPPFGAKIGITDPAILADFEFGDRASDPQILFLELCVRALKPGGRLGIVLPEGLFGNRRTGFVWDWLRSRGRVMALLDCPRTTFQPDTDTKTNVLFFQAGVPWSARVPVAVARHCGHDRRGRVDARDDFAELAWREVELTEPNYFVPRFYVPPSPRSDAEARLIAGAPRARLGELVDSGLLTVRKGVEVGSEAYGTGAVPFVRTSDIANFEISIDPTKSVDEATYERLAPALEPGDVLLVVDGRYRIGASALLTERNVRCAVQSHLRILGTPSRDRLDPYALLFALNLPSVREGIRNLVFIQSTLGTVGARLFRLEIPLLVGDGPWRAPLSQFRASLVARDAELAALRSAVGPVDELL